MRVLTWNLYHGRAVPPAGRDLLAEFAAALAGWDWDVALLQEVPPWWPPALARACDAQQRSALTSRNALPALRRSSRSARPTSSSQTAVGRTRSSCAAPASPSTATRSCAAGPSAASAMR